MKLRFDDQAINDLIEIRDYILEHASEAAANRVRAHFRDRFHRLKITPSLGISSTDANVRVLSPTKYPYRIYFTVQGDTIVILHIRHTSRRSPASEPSE